MCIYMSAVPLVSFITKEMSCSTFRLSEATSSGDTAALRELLNEDPYILHSLSLNAPSDSPLHLSCLLGHAGFARLVMEHNNDLVRETNQQGLTPLHLASSKGHLEIVKDLLRIDKEMCRVEDQSGMLALHCAAMKGKTDVARELIKQCPETASERTTSGETVLHLAVINNRFKALEPLVGFLIDEKLDMKELFDSQDEFGQTILHLAVEVQNFQMVKFIIGMKVDLTIKNSADSTALDIAVLRMVDQTVVSKDIDDLIRAVEAGGGNNNYHRTQDHRIQIIGGNGNSNQTSSRLASPPSSHLDHRKRKKGNELGPNGLLMAAGLIATITFQALINPPGGVWQEWGDNSPNKQGLAPSPPPSPHLSHNSWRRIRRVVRSMSLPPVRDEHRHMPGKSIARELYAYEFLCFLVSCVALFHLSLITIFFTPIYQHVSGGGSISSWILKLATLFFCYSSFIFTTVIAIVTDDDVKPISLGISFIFIFFFFLILFSCRYKLKKNGCYIHYSSS